jgi:ribonuclease Y
MREEAKEYLADAQKREQRASQREREVAADQRAAAEYTRTIEERSTKVAEGERRLEKDRAAHQKQVKEDLATVANVSVDEAREELVQRLVSDAEAEARASVRRSEKRALEEAENRSREILATAMQRQASETTTQQTVTWVSLPSEEMKGRIIGREGRNIRAFESLTGVNLIVEDGTDAVMLSSFDVERREVAEATLAALVADGRIQPHRIEAAYAAALQAAPERNRAAGLDAVEQAGVGGMDADVVDLLGRLRLRSSYGQNVLGHLVESARLAAIIAAEMGADAEVARRAAFLHDIGKAFGPEREGTHAAIGGEIAAAYGESAAVVHAIAAHHNEIPLESLEAVIVQVADAVSASRPGARREDYEGYVERLESLEKTVKEFDGVAEVVAMSAGREIRVVVVPDKVGDVDLEGFARRIADHIHHDPRHQGEVKVTVIRELRAEAVAE